MTDPAAAPPPSDHLVLFHMDGTRSERVVWLMEELGLPYDLHFKPGMEGVPAMKAAHPMGTVPTLVDGPDSMVESGAILEYIINRYGGGRMAAAPSASNYAAYLMWMHFAEGSAATRIITDYIVRSIPDVGNQSRLAGRMVGGAGRVLKLVDAHLGLHPYFANEQFTAADINMHFPLKLARGWGVDLEGVYPNVAAWFARVESRPGYLAAMAKGSPNGTRDHPKFEPLLAPTGKTEAA